MIDVQSLDLRLHGHAGTFSSHLLPTHDGFALVDCGPESTLGTLLEALKNLGLAPTQIKHLLLTHIHLDHAGAAGKFAREYGARVYVHERGAKHLLDPSRLLASATQIYGERMDALWGGIEPVPAAQLEVVRDGQRILDAEVLETPGHAVHHVAYAFSETIFTGDVAGMRVTDVPQAMPPTPPPDVQLEDWKASIAKLRQRNPARLMLAHFGASNDPLTHLNELERNLETMARLALEGLRQGHSHEQTVQRMRQALGLFEYGGYRIASLGPADVAGLERYWQKFHPELVES